MVKMIPVGDLYAEIDDEDFEFLSQFKWHPVKGSRTFYAHYTQNVAGKPKAVPMHVILMGHNRVNHIDGNGLNNQRANLRPATRSQSTANSHKKKGTSSQYKGVSRRGDNGRWRAVITIDGKGIRLGTYSTEAEAAKAYDAKARELFGEFARLNFPMAEEQSALKPIPKDELKTERIPREHGTNGAYVMHRYRGEEPCALCMEAHRKYNREYQLAWKKANREKHLESRRSWAAANPEKIRAYRQKQKGKG